ARRSPTRPRRRGSPCASSFEPRPLLLANVGGEDLAGREHGELLQRSPFALGVAQRAEQDLDLLAGLDGVAPPAAGAHEIAGARHLHHPDRWAILGALLDDAVDREADGRIDPAQLHDLAVDRHGDGTIEHGGGMMSLHRCDTDLNSRGNRKHDDGLAMIHHDVHPVAGLFRRHELAPLGLLDRDEDVMAVLILRFPVVAHLAYALDDVELARALAEEDARGLPGLG